MKKATIFYIISLAIFVAGMWAVLAYGSRLHAPPNLAGTWRLEATESGQAPLALYIEQSGRFVRIAPDNGTFGDFMLTRAGDDESVIVLEGENEEFIFRPGETSSEYRVERRSGTAGGEPTIYHAGRISDVEKAHGPPSAPASKPASPVSPILVLLVQLGIIIAFSRALGWLVTLVQQPRVVGEMIAGIMLGPSLLGWALPEISASLFPASSIPLLGLLSQLGVIFFLFIIGLELDPKLVRNRGHVALVVSHISIIAPLLLGAALALPLYEIVFHQTQHVRFASVALFMGAAMSITAFPVLARILTERNLRKTQLGAISITCAAIGDVTAWCLLACVVGLTKAEGLMQGVMTTGLAIAYVVIMLFIIRPIMRRVETYYDRQGRMTTGILGLLVMIVIASAAATEAIGIHALFGAFMAGAIMPKSGRFIRDVAQRIEEFTLIVLLPIFFAYTGLKTRIDLIGAPDLLMLTGLVIAVACLGKFGGSTIAAVACGVKWREASAIGILMNTRGLMELVILNIGRELGVITDAVFAMMVLMALVTTFLTTPILNLVYPDRLIRAARAPVGQVPRHHSILIPISLPRSGRALVRLADLLTGGGSQPRRILGLHLVRAAEHEAYSAAAGRPAELSEPLEALTSNGQEIGMTVETLSFVSRDAAEDIALAAREQDVGLVLMGFHKPIIGTTILGGTVHRVLELAETDVAIFVDRGLPDRPATILVPYLGSEHDRMALQFASTMARHSGAAVTVLHVVPPKSNKADERERLHAQAATNKVFTEPGQSAPVTFSVIESNEPISTVLEHCKPFDIVLIGVAEQWGLTSHLFGWRAERIARDCPTSMMIVRKAARPVKPDSQDDQRQQSAPTSPAVPLTEG